MRLSLSQKITGGKTYWVCRRHDGNKADCPTPQIPEPEIAAAVLRLYHKLKLGQETVLRPVLSQLQELRERELRSNRKISDIDNEIARISEQNLVLVRLKSKGMWILLSIYPRWMKSTVSCGSSGSCDAVFWRQPVKTGRSMTQSE